MFVTFLLLAAVTVGGTALTYLYEREDSLMARLAAGHVIGSAVFGTVGFLLACVLGLTPATVGLAMFATLAPVLLMTNRERQRLIRANLNKARGKLDGASFVKIARFAYYAAILVVLWFFFERAMIENANGILTGGSQNLGDLPFHLGAIFSFTEGNNFPPENPSFANAKFTYPFLADFITACAMRFGAGVRDAMLVQNVGLGFALVVILERFTERLTGSKTAGKIAPILLFLSGGLGFVGFLREWWNGAASLTDLLSKLPQDYTIGKNYRWGNALVTLFMTQRSLLFGMPLTLIALSKIWDLFASERDAVSEEERQGVGESRSRGVDETGSQGVGETVSRGAKEKERQGVGETMSRGEKAAKRPSSGSTPPRLTNSPTPDLHVSKSHRLTNSPTHPLALSPTHALVLGAITGTLPLIHVHSLAALFVVCAILFVFRTDRWKEWIAFGVGVSIIAIPELAWSLTGSATNLGKFIEPFLGWDKGDQNFFVFWAKNTGLFVPVLIAGLVLLLRSKDAEDDRGTKLLIFYLPFLFLFVISNTMKLAPWEWDNIKVLIYWFVGSLPFAAYALAWMWTKNAALKVVCAGVIAILVASGALDVWRTVNGQINYDIFSKDSVKTAQFIREKTPPKALFLNAPTYNSTVVLSGRRSLMRYSGHLSSYGIDYGPREDDVKRIYAGGVLADRLLEKNKIEYVIISPEETGNLDVNEGYFSKFPMVAENGSYRVFKIK